MLAQMSARGLLLHVGHRLDLGVLQDPHVQGIPKGSHSLMTAMHRPPYFIERRSLRVGDLFPKW